MRKQPSKALEYLQFEAAADHLRGDEEAAAAAARMMLPQGTNPGAVANQLPRSFMEYLAMARGVQDGFASLGIEGMPTPSFDYPLPTVLHIRRFCSAVPIPFTAFEGIRSSKHKVELTAAQESNVVRSLAKIIAPQSTEDPQATGSFFTSLYPRRSAEFADDISVPLPFVNAFFDQRCPELRKGILSSSRSGATYLLLAVITGHVTLCQHCLEFGANPNSMAFLQDESPRVAEMFHGYTPVFMAVFAEQLAILDKLSEYGGSVHVYDRWGRTPLHAAIAMNSVEVVQWLLGKGAPRYVRDCLNLIPAESADDDYFPDLAMPNTALHGTPPLPPIEFLKRQYRRQLQGDDERPRTLTERKDSEADAPLTDDLTTAAGASPAEATGAEATERGDRPAGLQLCHCLSGRPAGYCGCVDDMYSRWAVDRLQLEWSPGIDFAELSRRQSTEERQRMAVTAGNRRQK